MLLYQVPGEDYLGLKPLSLSICPSVKGAFSVALFPPPPSLKKIYRDRFVIQLRLALHRLNQKMPPLAPRVWRGQYC